MDAPATYFRQIHLQARGTHVGVRDRRPALVPVGHEAAPVRPAIDRDPGYLIGHVDRVEIHSAAERR